MSERVEEAGQAKTPDERIAGLERACAFYRTRLRDLETALAASRATLEQVAHMRCAGCGQSPWPVSGGTQGCQHPGLVDGRCPDCGTDQEYEYDTVDKLWARVHDLEEKLRDAARALADARLTIQASENLRGEADRREGRTAVALALAQKDKEHAEQRVTGLEAATIDGWCMDMRTKIADAVAKAVKERDATQNDRSEFHAKMLRYKGTAQAQAEEIVRLRVALEAAMNAAYDDDADLAHRIARSALAPDTSKMDDADYGIHMGQVPPVAPSGGPASE